MLAPVEVAGVNNHSADCGAVPADPLSGRVDDDVCAVVYGSAEVTACAEGVVDLASVSGASSTYTVSSPKPVCLPHAQS